jgi:hypothetical protein
MRRERRFGPAGDARIFRLVASAGSGSVLAFSTGMGLRASTGLNHISRHRDACFGSAWSAASSLPLEPLFYHPPLRKRPLGARSSRSSCSASAIRRWLSALHAFRQVGFAFRGLSHARVRTSIHQVLP